MSRRQRIGNRSLAIVVFLAAAALSGRAASADSEEVARKHASKANQLAAKNKCRTAIFEFTRALKTLKDPTLLFNRAECFRKVGRNDEAITDYEQFLAELPQAPNRAAIEARLAALRGTKAAPASRPQPTAVPPPLLKPGEKAAAPATVPAEKKTEKAATVTARTTEKPPVPAPSPVTMPNAADKPAAAPAPAPVAPAPAAPAPTRRAEKWTD